MGAIFIVGTTASGKTSLALMLAQRKPAVIISADSRQVFKEMDIVTGKDHPKDTEIIGIDLVNPNEPFSVSQWYDSVEPHYVRSVNAGAQVIVVGGTGFYVRALTEGIGTLNVPVSPALRAELEVLSVGELQAVLKRKDFAKFDQLNHSDQLNPRRLIRAIEVASADQPATQSHIPSYSRPLIGLYYQDLGLQEKMIRERVVSRLDLGAIKETKYLISKYGAGSQSMSALGYSQIQEYIKGNLTYPALIDQWTKAELSYVKRQLTYFRKLNVTWYDRGRMNLQEIYEHISS